MKTIYKPQDIIRMNLELQSVQRGLNKLGVYKPDMELITSEKFLNNFKLWEDTRRDEFINLVGGRRYYKMIKGFLTK